MTQSSMLDFKVFHGRTTEDLMHDDVQSVLSQFQKKTTVVLDAIGIADATSNIGKLGACCRENYLHHAH